MEEEEESEFGPGLLDTLAFMPTMASATTWGKAVEFFSGRHLSVGGGKGPKKEV